MDSKKRIGELLVEAGIITVKTLERALQKQKSSYMRLGSLLKEMGIVTDEEIAEALAKQCNMKTVKGLSTMSLPVETIQLVPPWMALQRLIFPLEKYDGMLCVAIQDPFDSDTIAMLKSRTGLRIYPMVATRDDILAAIMNHYPEAAQMRRSHGTVLLIGPSSTLTGIHRSFLSGKGYQVITATDSLVGLKSAFTCSPDIIVLDRLSPRIDYLDFVHALRAHPQFEHIPVLLMDSCDSIGNDFASEESQNIHLVLKPATPAHVHAKVNKILNSRMIAPGQH